MQISAIIPVQRITFNLNKDGYKENQNFKDNLHKALQTSEAKSKEKPKFLLSFPYSYR